MSKIQHTHTHKEINFPLPEFLGNYSRTGQTSNYFQNDANGLTFKLCERKEPTPLRPQFYLMQRISEDSKWIYLTSLYPKAQGYYLAELQRRYFKITISTDKGSFTVFQ
jgi:hypothetical protein